MFHVCVPSAYLHLLIGKWLPSVACKALASACARWIRVPLPHSCLIPTQKTVKQSMWWSPNCFVDSFMRCKYISLTHRELCKEMFLYLIFVVCSAAWLLCSPQMSIYFTKRACEHSPIAMLCFLFPQPDGVLVCIPCTLLCKVRFS